MKIKFLGVGAALNTNNFGSSILIDDSILIDAPPACPALLQKDKIDIKKINFILISHLHGDHYLGLPFLLLEYMLTKRDNQLNIFGSDKLRDNTIELLRLSFPESDPEKLISYSDSYFSTLSTDMLIKANDLEITPVVAKHSIETLGFVIKSTVNTIYYSSDTECTQDVQKNIELASHVIIDATTRGAVLTGHIALEQVIKFAQQYTDKIFYVTHRSRYSYGDINVSNIIFPKDGDEFLL